MEDLFTPKMNETKLYKGMEWKNVNNKNPRTIYFLDLQTQAALNQAKPKIINNARRPLAPKTTHPVTRNTDSLYTARNSKRCALIGLQHCTVGGQDQSY